MVCPAGMGELWSGEAAEAQRIAPCSDLGNQGRKKSHLLWKGPETRADWAFRIRGWKEDVLKSWRR